MEPDAVVRNKSNVVHYIWTSAFIESPKSLETHANKSTQLTGS